MLVCYFVDSTGAGNGFAGKAGVDNVVLGSGVDCSVGAIRGSGGSSAVLLQEGVRMAAGTRMQRIEIGDLIMHLHRNLRT